MIKLTNNPELNYGKNQITVVGAFEQDGRLYDIVVSSKGDFLKKGGQVPDLARRIQSAWKRAYEGLAPKRRAQTEQVVFSYFPQRKVARVITPTHRIGKCSRVACKVMRILYRDLGVRVIETRLHESRLRPIEPSEKLQALQAACEPIFAKHTKNSKHLFFNYTISEVKSSGILQGKIRRALEKRKGDDFEQIEAFIRELQAQLPPGGRKDQREQFARRLFATLFLSEANQALFLVAP